MYKRDIKEKIDTKEEEIEKKAEINNIKKTEKIIKRDK
jgi:hypothetical protein